jgi:hypothetical protein
MGNIVSFPSKGREAMAERLEQLAADLRSGELKAETMLMVFNNVEDEAVHVRVAGHHPKRSESIGLFHYAAHMMLTDDQ